jgi:autotransporter-associated beta strand protein
VSGSALVATYFMASPAAAAERPIMTYTLHGSVDTTTTTGQQIASAMAAAVENFNRYAVFTGPSFGSYPISARYDSSVPTANGSGSGVITFGGQRNTRVAQHELGHVLGAGQHSAWGTNMVNGVWQGDYAQSVVKSLDGPDSRLEGDAIHFWPYGLNYDSEWNSSSARRNVLVTAAWREDMGIGYTWPPVNGPATGTYRLTPINSSTKALRSLAATSGSGVDIANYGNSAAQQCYVERQADGSYEIKSVQASNLNLSVPGASTTEGADLQFISDNNSDAQRWYFEPHGTGFRITSKNHLLRVVEAEGAGSVDGTLVQSGEYTGVTGNHQIWRLDPVIGAVNETIAYWSGDESALWTTSVSNGTDTNWRTSYQPGPDFARFPDELTLVYFPEGTPNQNTILGQPFTISGVFTDSSAAASIGGTHDLTLGAQGLVAGFGAGGATINTTGQVILSGSQVWRNDSVNPLTVSSTISGAAKLTLGGAGTFIVSGNNTYNGGTELSWGTLQIGNGGTTGSILGNVVNNGSLVINRSNDLTFGGVVSGSGSVRKTGAGTLTLPVANTYTGGTTNTGGTIAVTHGGALGTGALGFPVNTGGVGKLRVSNAVTVPNIININGSASGSTSSGVIESTGNNTLNGAVTWNAGGGAHTSIVSFGGLLTLGGDFSTASPVTGSRTLNLGGLGDIRVNGAIKNGSATVKVVKAGSGTATLAGANTYTGGTSVNAGRLFAHASGLSGGSIEIASGATLTFTGNNQTNSSTLSGAGGILNDSPNTIIFTGNHSAFNGTFLHAASGNNTQFNSAMSGSANAEYSITAGELIFALSGDYTVKFGALSSTGGTIRGGNSATGITTLEVGSLGLDTSIAGNLNNGGTKVLALSKVGSGTLTVSGANSYGGATLINSGTLLVNGSNAASATTVFSGATFGGSGTAGSLTVQNGGVLAPGGSAIGTFNVGNTALNGTLAIEVADAASSDQLNANGSLALGGALTIAAPAGLPAGTAFTIISKTTLGSPDGTFMGLPQDSLIDVGGNIWKVSYTGGDGNDVVITVVAPHALWLEENFGANSSDSTIAGDLADPDKDGICNLLERAFGGDPNTADSQITPAIDRSAPLLSITYRKSKTVSDLEVVVEESEDLSEGSWTNASGSESTVSDLGSAELIRFAAPPNGATMKFLRVRVSHQE